MEAGGDADREGCGGRRRWEGRNTGFAYHLPTSSLPICLRLSHHLINTEVGGGEKGEKPKDPRGWREGAVVNVGEERQCSGGDVVVN